MYSSEKKLIIQRVLVGILCCCGLEVRLVLAGQGATTTWRQWQQLPVPAR